MISLNQRPIQRVAIIDDDQHVRASYEFQIEDMNLTPVQEIGPFPSLEHFISKTTAEAEAAICDHHLKSSNYATFNGAEVVARLYEKKFPAVLCTRWETADIDEIRRFRRHIAVLLNPEELNPDNIVNGFELCLNEFKDNFRPSRKPWRTLVRVADIEHKKHVYVVVSGWDPQDVIRLSIEALPAYITSKITPGARLFAHVNIGAERQHDLFFEKWEPS